MKLRLFVLLALLSIFFVNCTKDEGEIIRTDFGKKGEFEISSYTSESNKYSTIYYPTNISSIEDKSPLIFFSSGWFSEPQTSATYESLISFMVSHGNTVVYTYEGATTDPMYAIREYDKLLNIDFVKNNILKYVATDKLGIVGHSAGGGMAFKVLDYYTKEKQYGENGRFLMTLDPWFAFEMSKSDMENLPRNTNIVFIKFGEGGNNDADGTDARIPLTEFYLLNSISNNKKDYQIYENADHTYPKGNKSYEEMQGILKPLDALMDFTFKTQNEEVRKIALENGNDDPYANGNGIQVVKEKNQYAYPCDGANTLIDYCEIVP